jgi:hypothetical protein
MGDSAHLFTGNLSTEEALERGCWSSANSCLSGDHESFSCSGRDVGFRFGLHQFLLSWLKVAHGFMRHSTLLDPVG